MSDLLKSAFGYFTTPNNTQVDNSFVGQIVEIKNVKLRIKKVIAEGNKMSIIDFYCINEYFLGGFAIVFVAQDVQTGKLYALKVKDIIFNL